jgi:hypothetical protein
MIKCNFNSRKTAANNALQGRNTQEHKEQKSSVDLEQENQIKLMRFLQAKKLQKNKRKK